MKMTFRWYGEEDSIPLEYIRQIPGVSGVVTAVYGVPVGEVWDTDSIYRLQSLCRRARLEMQVIESVPVHEDIKLGKPSRDRYIANFIDTLINLSKVGVRCVCYNFMPVFDWLRTDLHRVNEDGSTSLCYCHEELLGQDIHNLHLPGWDESYSPQELTALIGEYRGVSHDTLFDNLVYFLQAIMPTCEECGIDMAIHPDDPPWDMFGLPRIITGIESYERLFCRVPSARNGMTLCTGSLGARRDNDIVQIAKKYGKRIFFAHIRQLKYENERDFREAGHMTNEGDLNISDIVTALVESGFDGYVRPDHGRAIWGETGKAGYGLYDRALGATYLAGLFEMAEKLMTDKTVMVQRD